MVAQFGDFAFDRRPTRTARYLMTARAALDDRVDTFDEHVGAHHRQRRRRPGEGQHHHAVRLAGHRRRGRPHPDVARQLPKSEAKYLPRRRARRRADLRPDHAATTAEVQAIVDDYPFEIGAIDDDRPFFWHFTSFGTVLTDWSRNFEDNEIAIGERLLVVLVGVATLVAALFLWLPFGLTRRRGEAVKVRGRARLFGYFAALGLGFMLIEISMIQRFALLLGFPTLSLSVSLFTLLIATAVGARFSAVIKRWPAAGLPAVTARTGGAQPALHGRRRVRSPTRRWRGRSGPASPWWWRCCSRSACCWACSCPPASTRRWRPPVPTRRVRGRLVAWCWAVNGFFSVIGSSVTTILSMAVGFNRALLAGLVHVHGGCRAADGSAQRAAVRARRGLPIQQGRCNQQGDHQQPGSVELVPQAGPARIGGVAPDELALRDAGADCGGDQQRSRHRRLRGGGTRRWPLPAPTPPLPSRRHQERGEADQDAADERRDAQRDRRPTAERSKPWRLGDPQRCGERRAFAPRRRPKASTMQPTTAKRRQHQSHGDGRLRLPLDVDDRRGGGGRQPPAVEAAADLLRVRRASRRRCDAAQPVLKPSPMISQQPVGARGDRGGARRCGCARR